MSCPLIIINRGAIAPLATQLPARLDTDTKKLSVTLCINLCLWSGQLSKYTLNCEQMFLNVGICMGGAPIGAGAWGVISPTFLHRRSQGVHKFMTTNQ